jgi:hypothetical protein
VKDRRSAAADKRLERHNHIGALFFVLCSYEGVQPMQMNIHIERLILDGLPLTRNQGALVQAAVEAELGRLLTERGLAASVQAGGALPSVRADAMQLKADSTPAQMGQQIAQAVYGGLGQSDKVTR